MFKTKLKGFSLVELILAIGIFTMAMSSFAFLGVEGYRTLRTAQSRIMAAEKTKEITDLIMLVKNDSWRYVVDNTGDGQKHVMIDIDGLLSIENGQKDSEGYSYFFTIEPAYRDNLGNLVDEGGMEDPHTRIVDLTILFDNTIFGMDEYNARLYINNWNTLKLSQSTKEDFEQGDNDGTEISDEGEVTLEKGMVFDGPADWCRPELTHSKLTLDPRSQTLAAHSDDVYIVRGESSSDPLFAHVKVTPPLEVEDEPELEHMGFFSPSQGSNKAMNLHYSDGYVHTANPREARESVWIIDVENGLEPPIDYSPQVGWYSFQGSHDAMTIHTYEDYGFVGYVNKIDVFDISEKAGSRSRIGDPIEIGGTNAKVKDMVVREDYIFVAMTDYTSPLVIIDISDINNPQIVGEFGGSSNNKANTVFVSDGGNTAYIGTNVSSTHPEFFVIDTTNKSSLTEIGSFNTEGMNVIDLAIIEQENRAILGGYGTNKYIVLRLDNLEIPDKCGELDPDLIFGNVLALDVVTYDERLFTYILTREGNANELQIIEGGPGQGGPGGIGDDYIHFGEYTSQIFNMGLPDTRLYSANIYGQQPEGTSLKVQFKLGSNADLSDATWFGPDGTEETYFLLGENEIDLPDKQGQYFQYRVEMASNNSEVSPVLDKIEIIYD